MSEKFRYQISELIRQELEKSEVAAAIEAYRGDRKQTNKLWKFLRHPLVITAVGFCLTAVLGAMIETALTRSEDRAAIDAANRAESVEAQNAFASIERLAAARIARGALLRSAVTRDAQEEGEIRKSKYDEAYFEWNMKLRALELEFTHAVTSLGSAFDKTGETGSATKEARKAKAILDTIVTPLMTEIDCMLTHGYDNWVRNGTTPVKNCDEEILQTHNPNISWACKKIDARPRLTGQKNDDFKSYIRVREGLLREYLYYLQTDVFAFIKKLELRQTIQEKEELVRRWAPWKLSSEVPKVDIALEFKQLREYCAL